MIDLVKKVDSFKSVDKTQTIRTNEAHFIVYQGMGVCYLEEVTPGEKLMGFKVERAQREGRSRSYTRSISSSVGREKN